MSFDLRLFGKKLQKQRTQLQYTTSDIEYHIGIPISRMEELEIGNTIPSGDEVLLFSYFFKIDYRYFISNEKTTAIEQVDILYRKFSQDFNKTDRLAIQEFLFLCENEFFIQQELGYDNNNFKFTPKGSYFKQHGIEASILLRKYLGYKTNKLSTNLYTDFRKIGLHIFRRRLNNANISGLFIKHPVAGKCILINYNEDLYRQNFSLVHEVGHSIFDSNSEMNVSFIGNNWERSDLIEVRANTFAGHFLVPRDVIKLINLDWNAEKVIEYAQEFKVNTETFLIALKDINKITNEQYNKLKQVKIPLKNKEDIELLGASEKIQKAKNILLEKGLSSYYVRICHEAYQKNIITAQRLAEILLIEENELKIILKLFNLNL